MKWTNHCLIAGAPVALVAPQLVPVAVLGATAPDWFEWVLKGTGRRVPHRGPTHYVAGWALACVFFGLGFDWHGVGLAFAVGGLSHVLADALTVSGVPLSPLSDRKFHLFGGRLRTGAAGEYLIAWGLVLACALIGSQLRSAGGYLPFFPDWAGRYERGEADAKEWKDNRFRLF